MKLSCLLICLTFLLLGCHPNKKPTPAAPRFESFEISYTEHFDRAFSFLVDSSRIYFSPDGTQLRYGHLSDSLFDYINACLLEIQEDTTIKSKGEGCSGCPAVALKAVTGGDTIRIVQKGMVDDQVKRLVEFLASYIAKSKHPSINTYLWWETEAEIAEMPPSINVPGKRQ